MWTPLWSSVHSFVNKNGSPFVELILQLYIPASTYPSVHTFDCKLVHSYSHVHSSCLSTSLLNSKLSIVTSHIALLHQAVSVSLPRFRLSIEMPARLSVLRSMYLLLTRPLFTPRSCVSLLLSAHLLGYHRYVYFWIFESSRNIGAMKSSNLTYSANTGAYLLFCLHCDDIERTST